MTKKELREPRQAAHPNTVDEFTRFLLAPVNEGKTKPVIRQKADQISRKAKPRSGDGRGV